MSQLYKLPDEILRIIFEYSHNMLFRDVTLQFLRIIRHSITDLSPYPLPPYIPSVVTSILIFKNNDLLKSAIGWRYVHNRRTNDLYVHYVTVLGAHTSDTFSKAIGRYPYRFSFVAMRHYDKAKLHELCAANGLPHRKSYTRDKLVTYLLKQPD